MEKLLLSPEEAAAVVGVGRTTMYQLLSSGAIRSIQVGKLRRIPVAALNDWVAQQVAETQSELVSSHS